MPLAIVVTPPPPRTVNTPVTFQVVDTIITGCDVEFLDGVPPTTTTVNAGPPNPTDKVTVNNWPATGLFKITIHEPGGQKREVLTTTIEIEAAPMPGGGTTTPHEGDGPTAPASGALAGAPDEVALPPATYC